MADQTWLAWGTLFWWLWLLIFWLTTVLGLVINFLTDIRDPSMWGFHVGVVVKGLVVGVIWTVVAYVVIHWLSGFAASGLLALLIGGLLLYGVASLGLTVFGKGGVMLSAWGVFGSDTAAAIRASRREAAGLPAPAPVSVAPAAVPPPVSPPVRLAPQVIESEPATVARNPAEPCLSPPSHAVLLDEFVEWDALLRRGGFADNEDLALWTAARPSLDAFLRWYYPLSEMTLAKWDEGAPAAYPDPRVREQERNKYVYAVYSGDHMRRYLDTYYAQVAAVAGP